MTDDRKARARAWFEALRDTICAAFEALEDEAPTSLYPGAPGRFVKTPWRRGDGTKDQGGGVASLMRGRLFEKVGVPILGLVENMAMHVCSNCGHVEHIFGEGGGKRYASERGIDFLGSLPLDMAIRLQADGGKPTVVSDPDGQLSGVYKGVARQMAVKIAGQSKDFSSKIPTIRVSKST